MENNLLVSKSVIVGIIFFIQAIAISPSIAAQNDSMQKPFAIPVVEFLQTNTMINGRVSKMSSSNIVNHWFETQKLQASDAANFRFGWSVSLSGNTALVGAFEDDGLQGSAYVFTRSGSTWTLQQKLLASDGEAPDSFGYAVSLDGDTALIGAVHDDGDKGSAYVFTRTATTWTQQAKLVASDGEVSDLFGWSVSLSGDTALIGAIYDDDSGTNSGSVYVFNRTGTAWMQQAKLLAGTYGDEFGYAVSLDGDTALIGARGHYYFTGAAYAFTRTGTTWTQQAKLLASDGSDGDWFGCSVSLTGDTVLIGAIGNDDKGADTGSAYVFTRTGTAWAQQAKLLASDGVSGDWFGSSVSLSGETALIGAWYNENNGVISGSAYVFTHTGAAWLQTAKLFGSDGGEQDHFGCSVSLSGDTALIGAEFNEDNWSYSGSAYVFTCTETIWTQQAKLSVAEPASGTRFGCSISVVGDTAVIGADREDNSKGAAYVFTRSGSTWTLQQKLFASDGAEMDGFGGSVSLSGDTVLIGAGGDDDNGDESGSVYVFTRTDGTWTQQIKLLASDGTTGDYFGSVSLSGDTALIGASGDDDNGLNAGSAYVFICTGNTWTQQQKLLAPDGAEFDWFGGSVSLSGDTALIGASCNDFLYTGSAYVFTRMGSIWTLQAKLQASDPDSGASFGCSVTLSGDTALIGAYGDDGWKGAAYVFTRTDTTWSQQAKLLPVDDGDWIWVNFGCSVSLSGDTALIGANWDDDHGYVSGSVYVFTCTGSIWTNQAKLVPSDGQTQDYFGSCVFLSGDTAFIGTDYLGASFGVAYVFTKVGFTVSIMGGRGVNLRITNNGIVNASSVPWLIQVQGGILGRINKTVNGTIDISAGGTKTVGTGWLFGFGRIIIIAKVFDEGQILNVFKIGPFLFVL